MKNFQILFVSILILACVRISAQNTPDAYNTRVNYIFANVDHSRVTTGLLSDYGIQVIPPDYYDGSLRDSNEVDINAWRTLYGGIYSSRFNNISVLPSQTNVFNAIVQNMPAVGQPVPLAVMCINYNRLRTDAFTAGLVTITNEQLFDVAGKNPYETKTLFAAAPLQTGFTSLSVQFILKSSLYFTNSGKTITSINIDPGDGNGFRAVYLDSPFSATYPADGNKAFIVKFSFSDGTTLQTHSKIAVNSAFTLKSNSLVNYIPSSDPSLNYPVPATSLHSGGTINVALSRNNKTGKIQKPIVVVKGWDPWKIFNDKDLHITIKTFLYNTYDNFLQKLTYEQLGCIEVPINSQMGGGSLEGYLNDNGYDIVFLDYNDGTDDIKRNAKLLKEVIRWVNDNKVKVDIQPNVVLGISMGGLVARWALREMENEKIDHQTVKLITMDSPHKGANIPVGVQAAVYHASSLGFSVGIPGLVMTEVATVSDYVSQLKQVMEVLNATASKQMLIYKVSMLPNGILTYDNSVHDAFQAEYDALGLPQKCQNIAISDGAGNGTVYFPPNAELINYSANYSLTFWQEMLNIVTSGFTSSASLLTNYPQLAINIIPGKTEIKGECNINAIPSQSGRVYHARLYVAKKLLLLIPVNVDITNCDFNSANTMVPIDGVPGGGIDVTNFLGQTSLPANAFKQMKFCFVPAVSALALKDWKTYLIANLNSTNFISNGQTPFDSYFSNMPTTNFEHTQFNSSADYILSKFGNCPDISPGATISGSTIICASGTSFKVNGIASEIKVNWDASSNLSISDKVINPSIIKAISSGTGWVNATLNNGCMFSTLPQYTAWVGPPNNSNLTAQVIMGPSQNQLCLNSETYIAAAHSDISRQGVTSYTWNFGGWSPYLQGYQNIGLQRSRALMVMTSSAPTSQTIYIQAGNLCPTLNTPFSKVFYTISCGGFLMVVSPNPATDNIELSFEPEATTTNTTGKLKIDPATSTVSDDVLGSYEVQLFSEYSILKKTVKSDAMHISIPVNDLPNGKYFIQLIRDGKAYQKTLIILR